MNLILTPTHLRTDTLSVPLAADAPLRAAIAALVTAILGKSHACERYEVEDTVLRASPFAWDLSRPEFKEHRPAFDAIVAAIADAIAAEQAARDAAEAIRKAAEPALLAKQAVLEAWQEKLAGRFTDPLTGIEIDMREDVRNLLTGQVVLVTTAINIGAMKPDEQVAIWDADGKKHALPASDLIGLILRYGQAWSEAFDKFAP